jgi:hypothetical protein
MRKATIDAVLESYTALLSSTKVVLARGGEDTDIWQDLVETWLRCLRTVVDTLKGGKKVSSSHKSVRRYCELIDCVQVAQHSLTHLPTILLLLSSTPVHSAIRDSLLQTLQFALFGLDNLRRGLARESYHAGAKTNGEESENAASDLFKVLKDSAATSPEAEAQGAILLSSWRRSC